MPIEDEFMLPISLVDVALADIRRLINSEVVENINLEYKEALPSDGKDDKREFLADVAAIANMAGGDIVYGLADRRGDDSQSTGIPDRISGMRIDNPQTEIARLSNLIRDGIAPRLVGVAMQTLSCPDGDLLIVRIPRSWNKPHMVTLSGANKFFVRGATGKNPMSVDEIGRAFSEQAALGESIRNWRSHRAELASRSEGPVPLAGHVKMLFHVIPASAFARNILRSVWAASEFDKRQIYEPHIITNSRYNADGFLCTSESQPEKADAYAQVFRSGVIEYADSQFFGPVPDTGQNRDRYGIYGQELEKQMLQCYQNAIQRLSKVGEGGPLYIGFSLMGIAKKIIFSTTVDLAIGRNHRITKDIFNSPEVLVDINEPELRPFQATLLPLVNTMWQVGGLEGSPFLRNGVWDPFKDL
jgi:hypothetical protein